MFLTVDKLFKTFEEESAKRSVKGYDHTYLKLATSKIAGMNPYLGQLWREVAKTAITDLNRMELESEQLRTYPENPQGKKHYRFIPNGNRLHRGVDYLTFLMNSNNIHISKLIGDNMPGNSYEDRQL
nr:hypothetical protein HmN_000929600 [Hymenolepis microstoma]